MRSGNARCQSRSYGGRSKRRGLLSVGVGCGSPSPIPRAVVWSTLASLAKVDPRRCGAVFVIVRPNWVSRPRKHGGICSASATDNRYCSANTPRSRSGLATDDRPFPPIPTYSRLFPRKAWGGGGSPGNNQSAPTKSDQIKPFNRSDDGNCS